jgi:hypothetical protein
LGLGFGLGFRVRIGVRDRDRVGVIGLLLGWWLSSRIINNVTAKTRKDIDFEYRLLNVVTNECMELNCNACNSVHAFVRDNNNKLYSKFISSRVLGLCYK